MATVTPNWLVGVVGIAVLWLPVTHGMRSSLSHQSDYQIQLFDRVSSDAQKSSDAATPALLSAVGQPAFQSALSSCCPSLASLSAQELLDRMHAEIAVMEVSSSFWSHSVNFSRPLEHFTLAEANASSTTFLENSWEVGVKDKYNFSASKWFPILDAVDTQLYGLKQFATPAVPVSEAEAGERTVHGALNSARVDAGNPVYGDISVVLSRDYIDNMTILSAVDTFGWATMCNSSTKPPFDYKVNCDAYQFALGTVQALDHLLLANANYWGGSSSLLQMFSRLEQPWGKYPVDSLQLLTSIEATPAGQLVFPQAVHFVIGSFPLLFGTALGEQLRAWCARWGWVLAWALGPNVQGELDFWDVASFGEPFAVNRRLWDPVVESRANLTAPNSTTLDAWGKLWQTAAASRNNTQYPPTNQTWGWLWDQAKWLGLGLNPVFAGSCGDPSRCVGVENATNQCVCYPSP